MLIRRLQYWCRKANFQARIQQLKPEAAWIPITWYIVSISMARIRLPGTSLQPLQKDNYGGASLNSTLKKDGGLPHRDAKRWKAHALVPNLSLHFHRNLNLIWVRGETEKLSLQLKGPSTVREPEENSCVQQKPKVSVYFWNLIMQLSNGSAANQRVPHVVFKCVDFHWFKYEWNESLHLRRAVRATICRVIPYIV